jgi:hypothetical protein
MEGGRRDGEGSVGRSRQGDGKQIFNQTVPVEWNCGDGGELGQGGSEINLRCERGRTCSRG